MWIGGACAEIDAARRSTLAGSSKFWSAVIEHSAYSSVVVDVMAGASAGGLNGVVYATALRHDFDMAEMRDVVTGFGHDNLHCAAARRPDVS